MIKLALIFCSVLVAFGCASNLVGTTIPPYPPGLIHRQGVCVARESSTQHVCDFSVGILEELEGTPRFLFGARMAGRDASNKPIWTITDVMPYPILPNGYFLTIGFCRVKGRNDKAVFAAVRNADEQWLTDVLWAKRYDLQTEKFIEQPAVELECENEGWGL
jgi:hypothetical protein